MTTQRSWRKTPVRKFDAFTVNTSTNLGWSNFYSRIVTSRNEAYGRYAPPAAFVSRFPAGIGEVRIPASDGFAETTAVLGVDAQLRKRFIEIGPRESFWTDWTADAVAGFNGTLTVLIGMYLCSTTKQITMIMIVVIFKRLSSLL